MYLPLMYLYLSTLLLVPHAVNFLQEDNGPGFCNMGQYSLTSQPWIHYRWAEYASSMRLPGISFSQETVHGQHREATP